LHSSIPSVGFGKNVLLGGSGKRLSSSLKAEVYGMADFLKLIDGKKTYIGAIAFVGLALFQFYSGQMQQGLQSLVAAWTAVGLRCAIGKPPSVTVAVPPSVVIPIAKPLS
jgi:hypothetical protein